MDIKELLNEYLEIKLKLKPIGNSVSWGAEECMECSSLTYILKIDSFEPGIKVSEGELLSFLLEKYDRDC